MKRGSRVAFVGLVVCLFTGSCASHRYATEVTEGQDCTSIRESVVKARAAATGYKMEADRMVALAERVFSELPVATAGCTRDFTGVAFCARYTRSRPGSWETQRNTLEIEFRVAYPADLYEARVLCRSRSDIAYHRHSYVIDGMQIVRVYTWHEAPDTYLAVVFEPAGTE